VTEQPWNRKTILTITDDFSDYTKNVPATIDIYLTETATKAVATATVKVIDMPFNLVFFKTDHLGTPRVITDQDGKVLSTHDYLAYGEELTDPDFQTNRMKFTGHERDPETGLDYMLARYYTSGSGRFLQVDPVDDYDFTDPMSFNKYAYVRCNSIMGTDPTGLSRVHLTAKQKARLHFWLVSGRIPNLTDLVSLTDTSDDEGTKLVLTALRSSGLWEKVDWRVVASRNPDLWSFAFRFSVSGDIDEHLDHVRAIRDATNVLALGEYGLGFGLAKKGVLAYARGFGFAALVTQTWSWCLSGYVAAFGRKSDDSKRFAYDTLFLGIGAVAKVSEGYKLVATGKGLRDCHKITVTFYRSVLLCSHG